MNNVAVNIMNEANNIDDKDLLVKAIESHGAYSGCTKKVLAMLVQLAVYNEIDITVTELSKQIDFSRYGVYESLKILTNDKAVKKIAKAKFELNRDKLKQILQAYYNKQHAFNTFVTSK